MRSLRVYIAAVCCIFLILSGCGDESHHHHHEVTLSGTLGVPSAAMDTEAPVMVAVTNTVDARILEGQSKEAVIDYVAADKARAEFRIDLTEKGVHPGDEVIVIGFWDADYNGAFPELSVGDRLGVYAEAGRITPAYVVQEGENDGIHIDITRRVYDFESSIKGELKGGETGPVTLVAYAGEITSSDFTSLDFDAVVGFTTVEKKAAGPVSYTLDILPYGQDVPIENVQVFALLDANSSKTVDAGDKIGFYGKGEDFSTPVTIPAGETAGIDLAFKFTVAAPSADDVSISGSYRLAEGEASAEAPVYMAVFDGDDAASVLADPFASVRYFTRVPAGEDEFSLDLSDTGLSAGDEVIVIGFWDADYNGAFPELSVGDRLGVYAEAGQITPSIELAEGGNTGVGVTINREVFDFEASVSGDILGDETGPVTLVAYAGEITSSDFTSLDFDEVVGFSRVEKKAAGPVAYTLDILPYGKDVPIEDVEVLALLDKNNSATVDAGDRIGFYGAGDDFSTPITIPAGETGGIDLAFKFTVAAPSAADVSISGSYRLAEGEASADAPVYIAVFDGEDAASVLDHPFASVRYFTRVPAGEDEFSLDLSNTVFSAGDEVIVIGLWDADYNGAFPELSVGDKIGIYAEAGRISPSIELVEGGNTGVRVAINREVFDFDASVSGDILGDETGPVTLVAYAGEITSSDFTTLDFDEVVGFSRVEKKAAGPFTYILDILPYGQDVPIEDVQIFALLDANDNGAVDGGDKIGFFGEGDDFSTPFTIPEGRIGEIDIEFKFEVDSPSGFDISLAGTAPGPVNRTDPLYITVFESANPGEVVEDPYGSLKYFYRVPQTVVNYTIDLSATDLHPGEEVLIAALADKDFDGGFPSPTRGDKLGIVQNKETYQFTTVLNCGTNIIPPPPDFEFKLNKNIYEFDAGIEYKLDLTDAGSFGQRSRFIVLAIHVDGVDISVAASGEINLNIDIDYMLGADILPATAYDYIGVDTEQNPIYSGQKEEKELPILTAIYEGILVKEDSRPPEPLIKGYDHGEGDKERTAYLVTILDKNGNLRLDRGDEIGYYSDTRVAIEEEEQKVIDIPFLGEIVIPDAFTGVLHFPTPIPRIIKGVNREKRDDGTKGPYWISHFIEP